MAERKQVRPRICNTCHAAIETTAEGIKDHASGCIKLVVRP